MRCQTCHNPCLGLLLIYTLFDDPQPQRLLARRQGCDFIEYKRPRFLELQRVGTSTLSLHPTAQTQQQPTHHSNKPHHFPPNMKVSLLLASLLPLLASAVSIDHPEKRDLPIVDLSTLSAEKYTPAGVAGFSQKQENALTVRAPVCPPNYPRYCKKANLCCRGKYCCAKQCCTNDVDFCSKGLCYKYN